MLRKIENALIKDTFLGIEDHGFLTCTLHLDYSSSSQNFGGYDLTFEDYGIGFLRSVLETVGVDSWEELTGKHVRVDHAMHRIFGIGNFLKDNWFYPEGKEPEE